MKFRLLLLSVLLLVIHGWANLPAHTLNSEVEAGPAFEAQLIHVPITSLRENQALVVEARADGVVGRVAFMRLYFKSEGDADFQFVEMQRQGAGFAGEVPAVRFFGNRLFYFILAFFGNQEVVTYPAWNPYGTPLAVTILGGKPLLPPGTRGQPDTPLPGGLSQNLSGGASQPRTQNLVDDAPILVLSPEDGEQFGTDDEVLVAVSFVPPSGDVVDPKSVTLLIDDFNVSLQAEITENVATYSAIGLLPGWHRIVVQASTTGGIQLPQQEWTFQIGKKKRSARTGSSTLIRGRVFGETRHEDISDIGFHDNNIGGYMSGKTGSLKYDTRILVTTREDGNFQPRHRFTFNFDLPILGVTLGDTYPRFNDLMLWGKRVRGIHGRVHFGFINFDVVAGQTFRGITPKFISVVPASDSLQSSGTFEQNLLGFRTSFGNGRRFQLGFNLLKVRDDTTSIARPAFQAAGILPRDNIVTGSDFFLSLDRRRFEIRAAVAASLLSRDISNGVLSKQAIEDQFDVDLPFDPEDFTSFLILNSSTTPLDPRDLTSLAYNFTIRLNYFNNNFQLGYKSLGSEYNSLGTTFLRNNLRGFFIHDRLRVFQNKVYLNFGVDSYDDNFDPDSGNQPTQLTTWSTGFSIYPGARMPTINFSFRNNKRDNNLASIDSTFIDFTNPAAPDTLSDPRENNDTQDLSVQLSYNSNFLSLRNSISVSYILSDRNDQFVAATENSSNVEVFSVRTQYQFPLTTTINFARNDNSFGAGLNKFNFKMFGARAEYSFFQRVLRTYLGFNFTTASGGSLIASTTNSTNSVTNYKRTAFNSGVQFEKSGHRVSLDGSLIGFNDNGFTEIMDLTAPGTPPVTTFNPSFTDAIFRLFYEKRF